MYNDLFAFALRIQIYMRVNVNIEKNGKIVEES